MSEKQKRHKFYIEKEVYQLLEEQGKKDGLTVDQVCELALLYYFQKYDAKILELAKKGADPAVLRVFERKYP